MDFLVNVKSLVIRLGDFQVDSTPRLVARSTISFLVRHILILLYKIRVFIHRGRRAEEGVWRKKSSLEGKEGNDI